MLLIAMGTPQDGIAHEPVKPQQISDNACGDLPVRLGAFDNDHRNHGAFPQYGTSQTDVPKQYL